jgi:hypothetical protein
MVLLQGDILPLTLFLRKQPSDTNEEVWSSSTNPWLDLPAQIVKKIVHGNTTMATAKQIAQRIPLGTVEQIESALPKVSGPPTWRQHTGQPDKCKELAKQLHSAMLSAYFGEVIDRLDAALSRYFKGVRYLKPLRATAQRYYRRLDVSVSEIDPEGSNLPMFLDTLQANELLEFREWVKKYLDIDVYTTSEGEQLMVMAKGPNDTEAYNVADMGFGISQVLPVAAQLWATRRPTHRTESSSLIVLEQPELHLHPEYQARLADVFAGTIKQNRTTHSAGPCIIVETHSQHLVNRLGQLVEGGQLAPEDVNILLFEPATEPGNATTVRSASFDQSGILQNWPFGFFDPEPRDVV